MRTIWRTEDWIVKSRCGEASTCLERLFAGAPMYAIELFGASYFALAEGVGACTLALTGSECSVRLEIVAAGPDLLLLLRFEGI